VTFFPEALAILLVSREVKMETPGDVELCVVDVSSSKFLKLLLLFVATGPTTSIFISSRTLTLGAPREYMKHAADNS
jgi:hypothetical protein